MYDWLLIVEYPDGEKGFINLVEAIGENRLIFRENSLTRGRVVDFLADDPEYRADLLEKGTRQIVIAKPPVQCDGGGDWIVFDSTPAATTCGEPDWIPSDELTVDEMISAMRGISPRSEPEG